MFECEEDGLELSLLEDVHEILDLLVTAVELLLSRHELLLLLRERDELVQRLLVDVRVLLQLRVGLFELLEELLGRHGLVLAERVRGEGAEVADLLGALLDLGLEDGLLGGQLLQLLGVLLDLVCHLALAESVGLELALEKKTSLN